MKTECSEYQKRIAALILNDLEKGEKESLEAHLVDCPHCRSEREAYARTLQRLASTGEEEIPHHFFVYPDPSPNPWQLFCRMSLWWKTVAAGFATIVLFLGIAAVSRLQISSRPGGWAISFGRSDTDVAALKKDFLEAIERKQEEAGLAWMQEVRSEIARSNTNLTQEQQARLTAALAGLESRLTGRISSSAGQAREDTQILVSGLYRTVARQRAQDLEAINLRFDSAEMSNAINTRQTNEILGTLLQVADLRLKQ